eukprot:m.92142 g.92142  ORF g.92142 m.92142 type:complete len:324 (+) comp14936_c0_seq1:317-1288(+)
MADGHDLTQLTWLIDLSLRMAPLESERKPAVASPRLAKVMVKTRINRKRKEAASSKRSKSAIVTMDDIDSDLERCLRRALSASSRAQNTYSTASLIAIALLSQPSSAHGAPSIQITRWIQRQFPKLRMSFSELRTAVRQELTSNRYFERSTIGKSVRQADWSIIPSKFTQLKQALINGEDLSMPPTPTLKRHCRKSHAERTSSYSSSDAESALTDDSEMDLEILFDTITKDDSTPSIAPVGDWLVDEALSYSSEDNLSLSESESRTPTSSLFEDASFELPPLSEALLEEIDCTLPGVEVEPLGSAMSFSQFSPWQDLPLDLVV